MSRGEYDRLIIVQRAAVTADDYSEGQLDWSDPIEIERGWARVRFGLAQEKREAAQESSVQAATFELMPTTALLTVTLKDRISFDDSSWDITEVAPLDRRTLRFTAVRAV